MRLIFTKNVLNAQNIVNIQLLSQSDEVNSRKQLFLKKIHPLSFGASKNQSLTKNIYRTKKDFDVRFFSAGLYCSPLHSDKKLSKSLEQFLRKIEKTSFFAIKLLIKKFLDDFSKIRLCQFVPHIDSKLHAKNQENRQRRF